MLENTIQYKFAESWVLWIIKSIIIYYILYFVSLSLDRAKEAIIAHLFVVVVVLFVLLTPIKNLIQDTDLNYT